MLSDNKKDFILALYSLPGILIIYSIGFIFNNIIFASIVAGGAVTAGYGANKKILKYPFAPMIIAILGMSICATLGSLLGHFYFWYILCCVLLACLATCVGAIDQNAWWIVLQWSIAFFVGGYYVGDIYAAMHRGILILAGGLFQSVCIIFLIEKSSFKRNISSPGKMLIIFKNIYEDIDKKIHFHMSIIYTALTILVCFFFITIFDIKYYYWAVMTALVILKPDFIDTLKKASLRLLGTFLGIILADLLIFWFPSNYIMTFEILVSLYVCYVFANHRYAILSIFLTITTVLMFAINGSSGNEIAIDRFIATSVGGISAILTMSLSLLPIKFLKNKN
ncbi:Fusaric acid resistance protein-like [Apibacter mensalis]|uniref:Fusaric acid resistance protein-like n=1 Tax=Apibacter mensalis TaxID=1586267 RepID=A0A0X3AS99_9FLAO|nr:FUSC family protein [Apibacter mensalis]CVK16957.1 Fusaric acid resistance protein-like [Apibacter mensalis]